MGLREILVPAVDLIIICVFIVKFYSYSLFSKARVVAI